MRTATFCVESPIWNVVIGTFLVVVFGIPFLLVLRGYLTGAECGVGRTDQPACLLVVFACLLGAVAILSKRDAVTVDAAARSICWQSSSLGISYSTATWSGADLESLELRELPRTRYSAYWSAVFVRGPKGERMLLDGKLDTASPDAQAVIADLRLPTRIVDKRDDDR